ncbi:MAG: hypothetical protein RIN63_06720 [Tissierella sp.]|nr:hypothetical protein [Tissierella sp.]
MYIKILGNITDVIPEEIARGDMTQAGFIIYGHNQISKDNEITSYGKITDIELLQEYLPNDNVTIFDTVNEINIDIDNNYVETYSVSNIQEVMFDLQMRGNPEIPNYNKTKSLTSQENLKALFDINVSGISKSKKQTYIE